MDLTSSRKTKIHVYLTSQAYSNPKITGDLCGIRIQRLFTGPSTYTSSTILTVASPSEQIITLGFLFVSVGGSLTLQELLQISNLLLHLLQLLLNGTGSRHGGTVWNKVSFISISGVASATYSGKSFTSSLNSLVEISPSSSSSHSGF